MFWLIPGDFNYGSREGLEMLNFIEQIPDAVYNGKDFCIGEINVDPQSSKQLIDTYRTYGLLYNWFPNEGLAIRKLTTKPRSEFFAISHSYLRSVMLTKRWFAYEQTLIILLEGIADRSMKKISLGSIYDIDVGRSNLASAMQQVERTERALKLYWRECNGYSSTWPEKFRVLDHQSEQIRGAAMVILQQLLR